MADEERTAAQALYDTLRPHVTATLTLDGGGNAAIEALAVLLGQVYDASPADMKLTFLSFILEQLGAKPLQEPDDPTNVEVDMEREARRAEARHHAKRVH